MSILRDSSIGLGGVTPGALPRISNPRPAPPKVATPRDGGGLAAGATGGNFSLGGMTQVTLNSGATGTQAGADQALNDFESAKL